MSSLGGGPGSDLIGCLKFFEERKAHDLNFTYNSFDKDKHWSYCWANVSGCITRDDCEARLCKVLSPIFHELDITADSEVKRIRKFLNADLYTMLFFMSEVSKKREDAKAFFDYFFENVNSDSVSHLSIIIWKLFFHGLTSILTRDTRYCKRRGHLVCFSQ